MYFKEIFIGCILSILGSCSSIKQTDEHVNRVKDVLSPVILQQAETNLSAEPLTVTAYRAERSAGGIHDFYSEGDYWWPDPENPDGKYIRKDGQTNPDNFVAHRHAMVRFSTIVGNLTSAYLITKDEKYARAVIKHVSAWFLNSETRMNPHLLYAQAIKGRVTGRGIGIIDTIHLMEVAQSLYCLEKAGVLSDEILNKTKKWFGDYLMWLKTHPYGQDEMNTKNNHATCWVMQVAAFARYVGDADMLDFCRKRFKDVLLPGQMNEDGAFPLELARTKPFGYSLFNLDAMAAICQILSTEDDDLWNYTINGRNIKKGIEFIYPYVNDKGKWPYKQDVMYWNEWPVAHPFLLFGSLKYKEQNWFDTWRLLDHFPKTEEVIRNLPIRNPLIWYIK